MTAIGSGVLTGKVAVITGGTSGIGEASARLFREAGATVVVMGTNDDSIVRLRDTDKFDAVACNVADIASIKRAMQEVGARHGRIDVLFANAGIPGPQLRIDEVDEAQFDQIMDVNLKGMFFTVQQALPFMGEGGAIVLTSSVGAHEAMPMNFAYGASKAGVRSLGRSLAFALQPRGIRVNVLTPGLVRTPLFDRMGPDGEAAVGKIVKRIPMGRMGTPAEAAATALFLASPASSFMTGAELKMSGGQTDL